MFETAVWRPLQGQALRKKVIEEIRSRFGGLPDPAVAVRMSRTDLPFYRKAFLIRATADGWPGDCQAYLLCHDGKLHVLDGASGPIHETNAAAGIQLDPSSVHSYNRFFGFFVRGDEGPFHVLTGRSDPYWPSSLPAEVQDRLEALGAVLAGYLEKDEAGDFLVKGLVQYGRRVFEAEYSIAPTGMINMLSDTDTGVEAFETIPHLLVPPSAKRHRKRGGAARFPDTIAPELAPEPDPPKKQPPEQKDGETLPHASAMKAAFGKFRIDQTPTDVRDFFYHWTQHQLASGAKKLPAAKSAAVSQLMSAIMEDSGVGTGPPVIQVLKSFKPPEGQKGGDLTRFRALLDPVGFRKVSDPQAVLETLRRRAPHMPEFIRQVASILRASQRLGDGRIRLPPLLLVGPAGAGKSWVARVLCEALDLPSMTISAGGATDARFFAGTARGWSSATPSAPAELLLRARIANPALIIEELDKCITSQNGSLHNTLLTAFEPGTAAEWMDECLGEPIDISNINMISTANDLAPIPRPLANRMVVVRVDPPSSDAVVQQIDSVVGEIAAGFGGDPSGKSMLTPVERARLVRMIETERLGFRDLRRAILQVIGEEPPHLRLVTPDTTAPGGDHNTGETDS